MVTQRKEPGTFAAYREGHQEPHVPELHSRNIGNIPECPRSELVDVYCGRYGTSGPSFLMTRATAENWARLQQAAQESGLQLSVSSAFRSVRDQHLLIERMLERGLRPEEVFRWFQPPGFSEHHSGRALDISPGDITGYPSITRYEASPAFRWLCEHASRFGFSLSYPQGNSSGLAYEPWHWLYRESTPAKDLASYTPDRHTVLPHRTESTAPRTYVTGDR